jgi:hypothetical protein
MTHKRRDNLGVVLAKARPTPAAGDDIAGIDND